MIVNLIKGYINNKISRDEFCKFSEIVKALFVENINYLKKYIVERLKDYSIVSDYVYNRLVS